MDGVVLVDKPGGITSRSAMVRARNALGVEKAGHAGTLDPLATGLLVVCLGRGTLLSSQLAKGTKVYEVGALFGIETDTYDIEGKVLERCETGALGTDEIERASMRFVGEITQVPPPFSAVKVNGKPLYKYARDGERVEPAPRQVKVESVELVRVDGGGDEGVVARFRIACGPGTYVRSIIHEIGKAIGCGACVRELRRIASGPFLIERAATLEELESPGRTCLETAILSLEEATAGMPTVEVAGEAARAARLGQPLSSDWLPGALTPAADVFRVIDPDGKLIALYGRARESDTAEVAARAKRVIRPVSGAGNPVPESERETAGTEVAG